MLLRALLDVSPLDAKILTIGIFGCEDIYDTQVWTSNRGIKAIVEAMDRELGSKTWYIEQPDQLEEAHLVDHVHLNAEG